MAEDVGGRAAALRRADESVSLKFTRLMKATTSRYGPLTDPPIVSVVTAFSLMALLVARNYGVTGGALTALVVLTLLPVLVAVGLTLSLGNARGAVVDWLARMPFAVENMNAVLNGLGESLEVTFAAEPPATEAINAELDKVHPDSFVTQSSIEERRVEIRIGVVDSKRNPAGSNHERFARVRALVDEVLVPLAQQHPIVEVRVK
jgi:hypothetical protein